VVAHEVGRADVAADALGAAQFVGAGEQLADFSTSRLHGTIGPRKYELHADGDDNLVGTVFMGGKSLPFVLVGVSALWAMPPEDQATLLPLVLTCEDAAAEKTGLADLTLPPILTVDFSRNHTLNDGP
jgi:hypothetical protein